MTAGRAARRGDTCPPGPKGIPLILEGVGGCFPHTPTPPLFQQCQGKAVQPRWGRGSAGKRIGRWGRGGKRGRKKTHTHTHKNRRGAQNSPGLGFFLPLHDHKTRREPGAGYRRWEQAGSPGPPHDGDSGAGCCVAPPQHAHTLGSVLGRPRRRAAPPGICARQPVPPGMGAGHPPGARQLPGMGARQPRSRVGAEPPPHFPAQHSPPDWVLSHPRGRTAPPPPRDGCSGARRKATPFGDGCRAAPAAGRGRSRAAPGRCWGAGAAAGAGSPPLPP